MAEGVSAVTTHKSLKVMRFQLHEPLIPTITPTDECDAVPDGMSQHGITAQSTELPWELDGLGDAVSRFRNVADVCGVLSCSTPAPSTLSRKSPRANAGFSTSGAKGRPWRADEDFDKDTVRCVHGEVWQPHAAYRAPSRRPHRGGQPNCYHACLDQGRQSNDFPTYS